MSKTKARTVGKKRRAPGRKRIPPPPTLAADPVDNAPTPERMARGDFEVGSGVRVYRDRLATPLRRALRLGKLTLRQVEAGEWLEAVQRAVSGSPGQRSCLDIGPVGHGETESERAVRLAQLHEQARQRLTPEQRAIVRAVCYVHSPIGPLDPKRRKYRQLFLALLVIADWREGVRRTDGATRKAA